MGIITRIDFSNGNSLALEDDSIVVLVGPNNSGKSQTLRDVFSLCESDGNTTKIVSSVSLKLPPKEDVEKELESFSRVTNHGNYIRIPPCSELINL